MILSIDKVIELKKIIEEKYNQKLHLHDACGGQYFTFDKKIDGVESVVDEYLSGEGLKSEFSKDGLSFTVLSL